MPSTSDPLFAVDDPVSLIRSRMQEKRLFEARFLCRQLAGDLDGTEKRALERELAGMLTQVEQLRRQARALVAEGCKAQAAEVYGEIAAIAIDVPGVAEEQRALEGADILVARIAGKRSERLEATEEAVQEAAPPLTVDVQPRKSAPEPEPERAPQPADNTAQKTGRRLWLAAALLGTLALLAAALLWRNVVQSTSPQSSSPPSAQTITIRPLDLPVSPAEQPQSPPQPQQSPPQSATEPVSQPNAPEDVPSSPSLKLGTLQVETSERR